MVTRAQPTTYGGAALKLLTLWNDVAAFINSITNISLSPFGHGLPSLA